jgi:hypothetical protein
MLAGMSCDPSNEFDHLAQFLPLLDGIGISYEHRAPLPKEPGERTREELVSFDAIPKTSHPAIDPRCPLEDHPEDLSRAVQTLRKIEWLLADPLTRNHAIVLLIAYALLGPEARKRYDSYGGVGLWVGAVCATQEQRAEWIVKNCKGRTICLDYGNRLLDAARTAWENLPPDAQRPVNGRGRLRFTEVFSSLSTLSYPVTIDLQQWMRGETSHIVNRKNAGKKPGSADNSRGG